MFRHAVVLKSFDCGDPCTNLLYGAMLSLEPTTPVIFVLVEVTFEDQLRFKVPVRLYPDFLKVCAGYLAMKRWPSAVVLTMADLRSRANPATSTGLVLLIDFTRMTIS